MTLSTTRAHLKVSNDIHRVVSVFSAASGETITGITERVMLAEMKRVGATEWFILGSVPDGVRAMREL